MTDSIIFPDHITRIKPYIPGLPIEAIARAHSLEPRQVLKLASNENPLGPSPGALAALAAYAPDLSRYPDNDCALLTGALAQWHGVPADWVVTGAGSESVIGNAVSSLLYSGRKTAYSQYSFQAYANAVQRVGATSVVVPSPEMVVDLEGLRRALIEKPSVVYIANPGNPTGTLLLPDALHAFLQDVRREVVVILDEAYLEFIAPEQRSDSIAWVQEFPNLLVTRTFSKAYGLAGFRIGYGIAQPHLASMLRRVRAPFTVSESAQVAAYGAIRDQAFIEQTIRLNHESKAVLEAGLREIGMHSLPSHTNFVLARTGNGGEWAKLLERQGIIVRSVGGYGLPDWLRISIGMPEDSRRIVDAMKQMIAEGRAPAAAVDAT